MELISFFEAREEIYYFGSDSTKFSMCTQSGNVYVIFILFHIPKHVNLF